MIYFDNVSLKKLPEFSTIQYGLDLFDEHAGEFTESQLIGSELHDDGNAASDSAGNEANGTTGFAAAGFSTWQSQGTTVSTGSYALEIVANAAAGRFQKNIGTDFSLNSGDYYILSFDARHSGSGGNWSCLLTDTSSG